MAKELKDLKLEEAQDILKYLDLSDYENYKDAFGQKYLTVESAVSDERVIQKVTGKRMNEIAGKLHKVAKILNPEMSLNKFNEKVLEENIPEIESLLTSKLTELENKSKDGNDKKLNDVLRELEETKKSNLAYKDLSEKTAQEKEIAISEFQTGIKTYKINHQFEQYKNKLNWIDEPTDVQRIGFDHKINTSYKFDLDEKDNLIILDKEGKPIKSKSKAGSMADPLEILDLELDVNKLKKNNNARPINNPIFTRQNNTDNGRQLSSDAQKRMGKYQK